MRKKKGASGAKLVDPDRAQADLGASRNGALLISEMDKRGEGGGSISEDEGRPSLVEGTMLPGRFGVTRWAVIGQVDKVDERVIEESPSSSLGLPSTCHSSCIDPLAMFLKGPSPRRFMGSRSWHVAIFSIDSPVFQRMSERERAKGAS